MINELYIIFSRSLKIIISYPQILRLSFSLFALDIIMILGRKSDLVCLIGILALGVTVYSILLQIYFVLYVFKIESVFGNEIDIWAEARKYFWRFVSQLCLGWLTTGLISSPLLLLVIIFNSYDKSLGAILLLILFQFSVYVSLGAVALSEQILLHYNLGILKNLKGGLKKLGLHKSYYFSFFLVTSFITTSPFLMFGFIGSKLTNIDVFSFPIIPIFPFLTNYSRALSPFIIQLSMQFVYAFIAPYLNVATTLAYLNRRDYELN